MTSIPSDPGHPMRGFTEIDNTADEPGKRSPLVLATDHF